jgi:hypothetical protein
MNLPPFMKRFQLLITKAQKRANAKAREAKERKLELARAAKQAV